MLYELLARAPPDDAPVAAVESGEVVEALHVEGGRLPSRPNRGTPSRRGRGHLAGADTAAFGRATRSPPADQERELEAGGAEAGAARTLTVDLTCSGDMERGGCEKA